MISSVENIRNLGDFQASGLPRRVILDEIYENLCAKLSAKENPFQLLTGFDPNLLQTIETTLLAKQHFLLFSERNNSKSLVVNSIINLLDEYTPYIANILGSEHPCFPHTQPAKNCLAQDKEKTALQWLNRNDRLQVIYGNAISETEDMFNFQNFNQKIIVLKYFDKIPPKQQLKLLTLLGNSEFIHNQHIPDCLIIAIVESLDYSVIQTLNPELIDLFGAFLNICHSPDNSHLKTTQSIIDKKKYLDHANAYQEIIYALQAECVIQLRQERGFVDFPANRMFKMQLFLNAIAERRALTEICSKDNIRIIDFYSLYPTIFPEYSGELKQDEKQPNKFNTLISNAIKKVFIHYFPDPDRYRRSKQPIPYIGLLHWFNAGNTVSVSTLTSDIAYQQQLIQVPSLFEFVKNHYPAIANPDIYLFMEFLLHGLTEFSFLNKTVKYGEITFQDLIGNIFRKPIDDEIFLA